MKKLVPLAILLASALSAQAATITILNEDFENGLPTGWSFSGSTLVTSPLAPITTNVIYINGADPEVVETPTFNLSDATFVTIEFDWQFSVAGNATRYVDLQFWDGSAWGQSTRHARQATITLNLDQTKTITTGFGIDNKFRFLGKTGSDTAQFYFDNVTITTDATTVPEPAAAILGGVGFLLLLRRRRQC